MSTRFDISNRLYALIAAFVGAVLIFAVFMAIEAWRGFTGDYPREIVVEATGDAYVTPDLAKITLGINETGESSEELVKKDAEIMSKVKKVITDLGIEENAIKTVYYNVYPNYVWNPERQTSDQEGFRLEHNIEVRLKEFEKIGTIISQVTETGANVIGGVNFEVEDMETAKTEAREEAIAAAREKAKQIAAQSGLELGKLLNYYEYTDGNDIWGKGGMVESYALKDEAAQEAPEISPGEQEVSLTVSLTYRID